MSKRLSMFLAGLVGFVIGAVVVNIAWAVLQ
jgi:hypothetical protein